MYCQPEIKKDIMPTSSNKKNRVKTKNNTELTPWDIVKISRHPERPVFQDYLGPVFEDFLELHGDRYYSDDKAIIGGFARIDNQPIMLIGHYKGKNT